MSQGSKKRPLPPSRGHSTSKLPSFQIVPLPWPEPPLSLVTQKHLGPKSTGFTSWSQ